MDDDDLDIDLGLGVLPFANTPDDELEGYEEAPDVKAEPEENDQPQLATGTDAVVKTETEDEKRPVSLPQEGRLRKENIGTVVHITDMSWYTTDIEVEAACGAFGTVKNVKFFEDRSNGRSMGSCAVEFASIDEAKACIAGLNSSRVGQDDQVAVDWPGKRPPFKNRQMDNGSNNQGMAGGMGGGMPEGGMGPMGPMGPMMGGMMRPPMMGPMGPMGPMMRPMRPGMGGPGRGMRGGMAGGPKRPKY